MAACKEAYLRTYTDGISCVDFSSMGGQDDLSEQSGTIQMLGFLPTMFFGFLPSSNSSFVVICWILFHDKIGFR